jgi:hypothetical protein
MLPTLNHISHGFSVFLIGLSYCLYYNLASSKKQTWSQLKHPRTGLNKKLGKVLRKMEQAFGVKVTRGILSVHCSSRKHKSLCSRRVDTGGQRTYRGQADLHRWLAADKQCITASVHVPAFTRVLPDVCVNRDADGRQQTAAGSQNVSVPTQQNWQQNFKSCINAALPLWPSSQSSWLQIQRSSFYSRRYQIFGELLGLELGPLSLMSTIDRLCGLMVRVPGYRSRGPCSIPGATRFSEK